MTETMRAHVIEQFGGPDAIVTKTVARPVAGKGDVLVRVHAAGLNPVDWKTRAGRGIAAWLKAPMPWTLGWDFAGTIAALGEGADFAVGEAVYGLLELPGDGHGAYAEYVRVPAKHLARAPKTLDANAASAVPLAALTAWQALELAAVKKGERVLVHGASGGVGHFAVQLARDAGAHVVAVTSTKNVDFVRGLGAREVVDRNERAFEDVIRMQGVDVVIDTLGGETLTRSLAALPAKSRIVTLPSPAPEQSHAGAPVPWFLVQPDAAALRAIASRIDAGGLRVHVQRVFEDAREAHAYAEANAVRGKLVLTL